MSAGILMLLFLSSVDVCTCARRYEKSTLRMKMDVAIVSHSAFLTAVHLEKGVPRNAIISCAKKKKKCYEMPSTTSISNPLAPYLPSGRPWQRARQSGWLPCTRPGLNTWQTNAWRRVELHPTPPAETAATAASASLDGLDQPGLRRDGGKLCGTPKVTSLQT